MQKAPKGSFDKNYFKMKQYDFSFSFSWWGCFCELQVLSKYFNLIFEFTIPFFGFFSEAFNILLWKFPKYWRKVY